MIKYTDLFNPIADICYHRTLVKLDCQILYTLFKEKWYPWILVSHTHLLHLTFVKGFHVKLLPFHRPASQGMASVNEFLCIFEFRTLEFWKMTLCMWFYVKFEYLRVCNNTKWYEWGIIPGNYSIFILPHILSHSISFLFLSLPLSLSLCVPFLSLSFTLFCPISLSPIPWVCLENDTLSVQLAQVTNLIEKFDPFRIWTSIICLPNPWSCQWATETSSYITCVKSFLQFSLLATIPMCSCLHIGSAGMVAASIRYSK